MTKYFETDQSFEEIFKTYFNPLVNYIYKYLKDWENSREIVQNTFMKAWQNRNDLDIHTSVKNYLYRATRNHMIDFIRKEKKFEDNRSSIEYRFYNDDHEKEIDAMMVRQAIIKSLEKLKPKNRKIFELSKFEGLTYNEIAEHLNISKRSVEDNIKRAMEKLKMDLKENIEIFH